MPLGKKDTFWNVIDNILDVNYNPGITQRTGDHSVGSITSPLKFYDRHIGPNHTLQNVAHLPSLPQLLAKTCDTALTRLRQKDRKLQADPYHFQPIPRAKFGDAESVRWYYSENISDIGHSMVSKLCFHQHVKDWPSVFELVKEPWDTFYMSEGFLKVAEDWMTGTIYLDDALKGKLSQSDQATLHSLLKKFPKLAIWHVYPMLDIFMTTLSKTTGTFSLRWEIPRTTGYRLTTQTFPSPDGGSVSHKLGIRNFARKGSTGGHPLERRRTVKGGKSVTRPLAADRARYRPEFRHYIQHAWAQSVMHDTTFIILHCGRYERIGIRHRASQTLYLSGVIDTVNIKDPRYRKMHIGLHFAILEDALERVEAGKVQDKKTELKSKKRASEVENAESLPQPKRQRIMDPSSVPNDSYGNIGEHLFNRKLALVSLDYEAMSSSVPSSFIRIGESCKRNDSSEETDWTRDLSNKRQFTTDEYFTLKLLAPLGDGAVGVAHPAVAEVTLLSGEVVRQNLVFKMSFTEQGQKKLRDEFNIYCRMSRSNVKGVPDVHGLFHDAESDTLGLLMSDAGKSLRQRDLERTGVYGEKVQGTLEEKEAFAEVIRGLDKAWIAHQDIRAENLTIDLHGNAFIIDFDCAEYNSIYVTLAHQLRQLDNVFKEM
ncbi:hypothetical protein JR316_0001292 [Psilocybe cubensis]|uniref:Uncharacterized protein n=2 Tax=Psilocybe cubensis TaxID=181762 RepID=A0ACB8HH44_PSICU|nr:hypothetical protein JR316_0001292 [Psilocybe cubensis]KAH9487223.1 hypothetical protein JR316_0001292 [Psilocybe cubensis]